MITDHEAEKAADWLRDNAVDAGRLRADRIYHEEMRKHIKALVMVASERKSAADREADAYASPRYLAHLDALRNAVEKDEENRALREAAAMKIECWRTQSSNLRGRI